MLFWSKHRNVIRASLFVSLPGPLSILLFLATINENVESLFVGSQWTLNHSAYLLEKNFLKWHRKWAKFHKGLEIHS